MKTRQMTPFFHLLFPLYLLVTFILIFENSGNSFSFSFSPFWSVKYLNFQLNLPIWTPYHTFIESNHPEVTKNSYYVLFPEGRQKKVSAHGLYVIIQSNPLNITFKGSTKLYFIHYLHVVIVLFSTGLYKSVFSVYSFGKLTFCLSMFWFFMFLCKKRKNLFSSFIKKKI